MTDLTSRLHRRRAEILTEIDEVEIALGELRAERRERSDDDEHDPDGTPLSAQWSRLEGRRRAAAADLVAIDDALSRAEHGGYGICERCGRPIPVERLEVRPAARRCVDCASR
jgi:DnaK suppressor protein